MAEIKSTMDLVMERAARIGKASSEELRMDSEEGFNEAVDKMIVNLDAQLVAFEEKVKTSPEEYTVVQSGGGSGGGANAFPGALVIFLLLSDAQPGQRSHLPEPGRRVLRLPLVRSADRQDRAGWPQDR